ncbi:hypothetical protein HY642_02315 [Candidatus Woesearchaeota archaeon]|nr:hypothetical protein [Candidatus Woesearchaeota archaeon]
MTAELAQVLEKLDEIKIELDFIKHRVVDVDVILTDDDVAALEEAEIDLEQGKTKRLM